MNELAALTVRMYRGLLGDCFLIRAEGRDNGPQHILIDCGLLQGLPGASERMRTIAEDIASTTGGVIDLLVVTHEHWDHISGFAQAKDILLDPAKIKYRKLWLAWTEKRGDEQADALRLRFEKRKAAITRLALALDNLGLDDPSAKAIKDLSGFIGPVDLPGLAAAPGGRLTGARILEELQAMADEVDYLEPGTVLDAPLDIHLPTAVLGPPRKEERLFKDQPSRGANKETYVDGRPVGDDSQAGHVEEELFNYSLFAVDGRSADSDALEFQSPFAPRYSEGLATRDVQSAAKGEGAGVQADIEWFHRHYFNENDEEGLPQAGRRIDDITFQAPASLALKLDSDTNNTSLVLAFRLPDDRFLLFAADAQVGNWLSWHDQDYGFADRHWSAADILGATTLYKVGHHGSHNATLRGQGLALMTRDDLVAMVSTVEEEAKSQGRPPGWLMPNPEVKKALLEQAKGRLLRGDRKWTDDPDIDPFGRAADFAAAIDETSPLYVDFRAWPAPGSPKRKRRRA